MTKILEKYLTRDVPLILIESWYEGRVKYFKKFFKIPFPKTVFLSSNSAFEFYVDMTDFDYRFPRKLSAWSRVKENRDKLPLVRKFMRDGLDYFKSVKNNKSFTSSELMVFLSKSKQLLACGYSGVLVTHHFLRWNGEFANEGKKLFDQKLIKAVMKWREREGNIFMDEGANTIYFLLERIAKTQKWNQDLLKYITINELIQAVQKNEFPIDELKKRQNSRFAFLNGRIIYDSDLNKKLKISKLELKDTLKDAVIEKKPYIRGSIASGGKAEGLVRVIRSREQLRLVKRGEVLVAPMTAPWYLPVLKKVSAIVTDEGGLASHAAIISREFKIPCIIGTKVATKVFKDGDMVEVDANKGVVRKI